MSHDHSHSAEIVAILRQQQEDFRTAHLITTLAKKAMLKLLPNQGDSVTVPLSPAEAMANEDGIDISAITFFNDNGKLDIRPEV